MFVLAGKVHARARVTHLGKVSGRVTGFLEHRYKRRVQYRFRVKIRVICAALFLVLVSRFGWRFRFDLRWSTEDARTIGDFFPIVVLARVLTSWGHSGKISVSVVEPPNQFWKEIGPELSREIIESWQELATLVCPSFQLALAKITRGNDVWKSKRYSTFTGVLGPILTDGLVAEMYRFSRALGLRVDKFLLDDLGYSPDQISCSRLPPRFVTWGTRKNSKYSSELGDFRNLKESEIEEEFAWLLEKIGLPVVLLSSKAGVDQVQKVVRSSPLFSPNQKEMLHTRSLGFLDGMRIALASEFYFQRWAGGMGMPVIYSNIPYVIVQPKSWPIHPTPWEHQNQLACSTEMNRVSLEQCIGDYRPVTRRRMLTPRSWAGPIGCS